MCPTCADLAVAIGVCSEELLGVDGAVAVSVQRGHHRRCPGVQSATKHASFKVSCGRQFGEFENVPGTLRVGRGVGSITYLKMMKHILYGAHSNVAMGLGWRAARRIRS